jgi:hypothetical protein
MSTHLTLPAELTIYMICAATHFAYLGQSAVMRSKGLKPSEPPMP